MAFLRAHATYSFKCNDFQSLFLRFACRLVKTPSSLVHLIMHLDFLAITSVAATFAFVHAGSNGPKFRTRGDIFGQNLCNFDASMKIIQDDGTTGSTVKIPKGGNFWVNGPTNNHNGTRNVNVYATPDGTGDYVIAHLNLMGSPATGANPPFQYSVSTQHGQPFVNSMVVLATSLWTCPWAGCGTAPSFTPVACVTGNPNDNKGTVTCPMVGPGADGQQGNAVITLCSTAAMDRQREDPTIFSA